MNADTVDSFTHDSIEYDLTKVRKELRDNKAFLLPITDLLWIHKFDTPKEERIRKAKLRWPLIVVRWGNKWVVVDGLHRLELYRRKGIKKIPVKEATLEILEKCKLLDLKK
jgi:hypothetical protein